ncbi:hypothetical protein HYW32_02175 [Candidatus Berkelbacteria bacterium]|nr:hypothetical protein [Candidatus Berkelbacteria bacterium]
MRWFAIILLLIGLGFAAFTWTKNSSNASLSKNMSPVWGVLVRPFALDVVGKPTTWEVGIPAQLNYTQELGAKLIRANIESNDPAMELMINGARSRDLDVLLVLEVDGKNPVLDASIPTAALYDQGYAFATQYASKYAGRVQYYQLANEVSGTAAHQASDTGPTLKNSYDLTYDKNRYERVREYTRGLADGVKAADPGAKRMVTGHWVLVDIMKYLIDDKVDFEIIGWDWYSDMGIDPAKKLIDNFPALDLPGLANKWGKEFWLAEVNRESGSFDNQDQAQASYLAAVAKVVQADKRIKGMTIHMLPDMAAEQSKTTGALGLVTVKENSDGTWKFDERKPAFATLRSIFLRQ